MAHSEHIRALASGDEALELRLRTEFFSLVLATRVRQELPGELALKGGGMMRFVFGGRRFSKDLDFQCADPAAGRILSGVKRAIRKTERYVDFVKGSQLNIQKASAASLTVKVAVTCTDGVVLHSKLEISSRAYPKGTATCEGELHERVRSFYRVPKGKLDHIEARMAFGDKVLALADSRRMRARDVLDMHLLLQSGIKPEILTIASLVKDRDKDFNQILSDARQNLLSDQIRKNFSEEVLPTLLPSESIDDGLFTQMRREVDQFLAHLEEEYALQGQNAPTNV